MKNSTSVGESGSRIMLYIIGTRDEVRSDTFAILQALDFEVHSLPLGCGLGCHV